MKEYLITVFAFGYEKLEKRIQAKSRSEAIRLHKPIALIEWLALNDCDHSTLGLAFVRVEKI